jgi:hypothetical protein
MPIEMNELEGGKLLEVNATDSLTPVDYQRFLGKLKDITQAKSKIRICFALYDFHGWKVNALWQDINFDLRYFGKVERLALIGKKRWRALIGILCRPFIKATIRYFDYAEAEEGRRWLAAD